MVCLLVWPSVKSVESNNNGSFHQNAYFDCLSKPCNMLVVDWHGYSTSLVRHVDSKQQEAQKLKQLYTDSFRNSPYTILLLPYLRNI